MQMSQRSPQRRAGAGRRLALLRRRRLPLPATLWRRRAVRFSERTLPRCKKIPSAGSNNGEQPGRASRHAALTRAWWFSWFYLSSWLPLVIPGTICPSKERRGGATAPARVRQPEGDRGGAASDSCETHPFPRGCGDWQLEMASKRITQETFDAAVRENMEEFEMGPEEAVREAVEQFESQGVDLSTIVKTAPTVSADGPQDPMHGILQVLDDLQESLRGSRFQEVSAHLASFSNHCGQHKASRFLAAQKGAYPTLLAAWQLATTGDQALLHQALNALAALTDGQPDLLDAQGLQLLVTTLVRNAADADLICSGIRCVRHACLKHEQNRQGLVKAGVLPLLTDAIARHSQHANVVREACGALRVMTFDDDIRVPFGHAHEHAKLIVQENKGLKVLIEAARAFQNNPSVLSELCSTLSRLAVRNEFCQEVVDLGGLGILVTLLANCNDHQDLVKQVLSALRAIAGNDDVKDAIIRLGGTDSIVAAMNRHLASPQVCEQSCAALSVLALRKPENSRIIVEGGGALAALQAMKTHPQEAGVQKQACMLIRNLVSRSQDFSKPILDLGAEELIVQARAAHRDCEDAAKAALRDLGCHVELQELWTGQKGNLAL